MLTLSEDQKDMQRNPHKNWQKLAKNICHGKFYLEEKFSSFGFEVYLNQSVFKYCELGPFEQKKKKIKLASLKSNKDIKTFTFPKQSHFSSPKMSD